MARIKWGEPGSQVVEAGVSQGVLYPGTGPGVPWNGLVSIAESPTGSEFRPLYQDGVLTSNYLPPSDYSATLEAFTYPEEFSEFNGDSEVGDGLIVSNQEYKSFGLSYQTLIAGPVGVRQSYKIHLVYNALASPKGNTYSTISNIVDVTTMLWDLTATPVYISGFRPTAHFIVDSRKAGPNSISVIENILYGTSNTQPRLPTAEELYTHFDEWHILYPSSSTYPASSTYPGAP